GVVPLTLVVITPALRLSWLLTATEPSWQPRQVRLEEPSVAVTSAGKLSLIAEEYRTNDWAVGVWIHNGPRAGSGAWWMVWQEPQALLLRPALGAFQGLPLIQYAVLVVVVKS